jgi:hypothetical protein
MAGLLLLASSALAQTPEADFPDIPLPPAIESLIGMPRATRRGARLISMPSGVKPSRWVSLPDIGDAVAQVESAYDPGAVGGVGEVGLMQIRPTTAAMLGYRGTLAGLFEPEQTFAMASRILLVPGSLLKGTCAARS